MLNVLAILASMYPWQLGLQADALASAPEGIHPEWYFMSQFQILKVFGRWFPGATGEFLGIALFTIGLIVWAIIPLIDGNSRNGRRAKITTYIGLIALFGLIFTTMWGYWEL